MNKVTFDVLVWGLQEADAKTVRVYYLYTLPTHAQSAATASGSLVTLSKVHKLVSGRLGTQICVWLI